MNKKEWGALFEFAGRIGVAIAITFALGQFKITLSYLIQFILAVLVVIWLILPIMKDDSK
jgi:hypothetical protein